MVNLVSVTIEVFPWARDKNEENRKNKGIAGAKHFIGSKFRGVKTGIEET